MQKKYELLLGDSISVGDHKLYRIRALRDFGAVRRGDLGGYIECDKNLSHEGEAWVAQEAQVYGESAHVGENAQARGQSWVLGRVEGEAVVDDLAIIAAEARIIGNVVVHGDEIVSGSKKPFRLAPGSPLRKAAPSAVI